MRTPATLAALAIALATLGGCSTYRSFDHHQADARRVHETILAGIDRMNEENPDPETRNRRIAYMQKLSDLQLCLGMARATANCVKMTPEEYRTTDELFDVAYQFLETYAAFPGEVDDEGRFVKRPEGDELHVTVAKLEQFVEGE